MSSDFLIIRQETEIEFEEIADRLFNDYAIQNHESIYRLIEIEFYWTSPRHIDFSTYQRKHVNPKQGEWFFHYSGVDIALRNDDIGGYGGILIRGIYDIKNKKLFSGPLVCAMKLFSGTNVFGESIKTRIIQHKFDKKEVKKGTRIGLGENAKMSGTDKLNYRFNIAANDK